MPFPVQVNRFWSHKSPRRRPVRFSLAASLSLAAATVCAGAASASAHTPGAAALGGAAGSGLALGGAAGSGPALPHLDHVFVIVEENNGFHDVIGNPAAPNLNSLARTFGLATDWWGRRHGLLAQRRRMGGLRARPGAPHPRRRGTGA